ncbi:MAG: hypothetical protein JW929_15060 [Anaerolineales bacterium]|nr:hypothetical protein [Anaerolineales bacterium]
MPKNPEYVPGVCNIGPAEIRMRKRAGWMGLAAAVVFGAALILLPIPRLWRLAVFFPAAMSALGFLQAAMHFCAAYGVLGVFNLGVRNGETDTVEQAEFRRQDRIKAAQIILYSILAGAAAAAAVYLV